MSERMHTRREFMAASATAALFSGAPSWATSSDPTSLTILEAGREMRNRKLSPITLVEAYLDRIGRLDGKLNSFITVLDKQALVRANALDAELDAGKWRGPLHGIPIGLKDNIDTSGIATTAASAVYEGRVPLENAEVVDRLEKAGAIILGKLNMHEFAFGATSAITHFGPVHNPWDLERVPGGSSGGSGAAVAAKLCAGALGTDTGGSIRIPAAHCGIVGLKPTYGLASIRGIVPMSVSQDHVGPMCRSVADTALMLQVLAGYDPGGIASVNVRVPQYSTAFRIPTAGMRVGIPRAFYEDVDAQILAAMDQALEVLLRLCGNAQDVTLPPLPETPLAFAEVFEYHAQLIAEKRELYQPLTLERILQGSDMDLTDYVRATYELKLTRKAIERTFDHVDLLITPTMTALPVTIAEAKKETENGRSHIRNTMPFNLYGIPSVSIPCGFSSGGLPIGLQISGPALGEVNVLALAYAYEQATKWHERTPVLA